MTSVVMAMTVASVAARTMSVLRSSNSNCHNTEQYNEQFHFEVCIGGGSQIEYCRSMSGADIYTPDVPLSFVLFTSIVATERTCLYFLCLLCCVSSNKIA